MVPGFDMDLDCRTLPTSESRRCRVARRRAVALIFRTHAIHIPHRRIVKAPYLRVLLVEDSQVLTERLVEAIRQMADVDLIGTAETEAAAVAVTNRDPVDVIILDLHLRQGTGFGVMRALATTQLKPRIVVLTNYDLPEYKKTAFALGATHFLDKARDCGRLYEVLHEICESQHLKH
jgi:two-component system OmpR family response regulator